jgi:hypothetical protein
VSCCPFWSHGIPDPLATSKVVIRVGGKAMIRVGAKVKVMIRVGAKVKVMIRVGGKVTAMRPKVAGGIGMVLLSPYGVSS